MYDTQLYYVKLPNILGMDQRPFDRDTFETVDEDEPVVGPEGEPVFFFFLTRVDLEF